jgi:uncharacterized protein DUF6869
MSDDELPRLVDAERDRIVRQFFEWIAWNRAGRPPGPEGDELGLAFVEVEIDLPKLDPETVWPIILRLVAETPDDDALSHVGAGPLENLLWFHGPSFVDRVESRARDDARFAQALRQVWGWEGNIDEAVSERLAPFWRQNGRVEALPATNSRPARSGSLAPATRPRFPAAVPCTT